MSDGDHKKFSKTDYTFTPGDAGDLRNKIEYLVKNPDSAIEMGKNGRRFVEEEFNSEKHYRKLMEIYRMAMEGTIETEGRKRI